MKIHDDGVGAPVPGRSVEQIAAIRDATSVQRRALPHARSEIERAYNAGEFSMRLGPICEAQTSAAFTAANGAAATANIIGNDGSNFVLFNQRNVDPNNANACGPTALSMILASLGLMPDTLAAAGALDATYRPHSSGTAPDDLLDAASDYGLTGRSYNDCSFQFLLDRLAAGNSVMAMVDSGSNSHWVVVLGAYQDANGEWRVRIADPGGGRIRDLTRSEFEHMWSEPQRHYGSFINDLAGYKNFLLCFDRDVSLLPPARDYGVAYAQAIADGATDLLTAWEDFKKGRIISTLANGIGGGIKIVAALPAAHGRLIEICGDSVLDWSHSQWKKNGFLGKLIGGLGFAAGGLLKGAGWLVKGIGNAVAKAGSWLGGAIKSVGKAIGSVVNSVGKAIGSFFSGW